MQLVKDEALGDLLLWYHVTPCVALVDLLECIMPCQS